MARLQNSLYQGKLPELSRFDTGGKLNHPKAYVLSRHYSEKKKGKVIKERVPEKD